MHRQSMQDTSYESFKPAAAVSGLSLYSVEFPIASPNTVDILGRTIYIANS